MKTSFVATVFNEEKTIIALLNSIHEQTKKPDEVIIVDGGSHDETRDLLQRYQQINTGFPLKIIIKEGNRSVGRNEGIKQAKNDIILISDAGCILDKNWAIQITKPFEDQSVDVVAGYYRGNAKTIFQKCLIPYVLVMEDRVNSVAFLPATRSIAFRRDVWEKAGRFEEKYSHNEDYVFARKLEEIHAKRIFVKNAIVYWIPRQNLNQAFYMFYRFARGDAEAHIWRKKVILQFIRYIIASSLLADFLITKYFGALLFLIIGVIIYILWAVAKNYKYVNDIRAFVILPTLQFTADLAVLSGTVVGVIHRMR